MTHEWWMNSRFLICWGYPLRNTPHGAKYFTNRSKSGSGCLIVYEADCQQTPGGNCPFRSLLICGHCPITAGGQKDGAWELWLGKQKMTSWAWFWKYTGNVRQWELLWSPLHAEFVTFYKASGMKPTLLSETEPKNTSMLNNKAHNKCNMKHLWILLCWECKKKAIYIRVNKEPVIWIKTYIKRSPLVGRIHR